MSMIYYSEEEFKEKRKQYNALNHSFKETIIFHVGDSAGFYSEIMGMFRCMVYAYLHKIRFVLYADDANFSNTRGWSEFFTPFCEESHLRLHHYLNPRQFYGKKGRIYKFFQYFFKKILRYTYLTSDVYEEAMIWVASLDKTEIEWPLFNISGTVFPEVSKLFPLGMRFNSETRAAIDILKADAHLPESYVSVQIRGGDKSLEVEKLYNASECLPIMAASKVPLKHLFVFTDDYNNILYLREHLPESQIYTLINETELGYYNDEFQSSSWENRRKNLIKLFTMVEICCESSFHFGCEYANSNLIIKAVKSDREYSPLMLNERYTG